MLYFTSALHASQLYKMQDVGSNEAHQLKLPELEFLCTHMLKEMHLKICNSQAAFCSAGLWYYAGSSLQLIQPPCVSNFLPAPVPDHVGAVLDHSHLQPSVGQDQASSSKKIP